MQVETALTKAATVGSSVCTQQQLHTQKPFTETLAKQPVPVNWLSPQCRNQSPLFQGFLKWA